MDKQWYVVNTYSGHENKVKEKLEMRSESMDMQDYIYRVVIPEEKVIETKDGVTKEKVKKMFPGYILVEMVMSDDAWYVVRNTPGVTGFVGSSGKGTKPFPVPREQVEPVLKRMGMVDESMYDRYKEGDLVKVIHGPLEGTEGNIISINRETGIVEVETVFFGRSTKVEVDFSEIERI